MHSEFLKNLLERDPTSIDVSKKFGDFLRSTYRQDTRYFRSLFIKKSSVDAIQLRLDKEQKDLFIKYGLLIEEGKNLRSGVMVHRNLIELPASASVSREDWFISTDWPDAVLEEGDGIHRNAVFPIHYESVLLLKGLKSEWENFSFSPRVLDLFCGSGLFGIYASLAGAKSVVCADISERALAFTIFNEALNSAENHAKIEISKSDIFKHLDRYDFSNEKFDLILANPPCEPAPAELKEHYFIHSYGGVTGQDVIRKFHSQVSDFLSKKGVSYCVSFLCGREEGPIIFDENNSPLGITIGDISGKPSSLRVWGLPTGVDIRQIDSVPLEDFILNMKTIFMDRHGTIEAWKKWLQSRNVSHVFLCVLAFRRKIRQLPKKTKRSLERQEKPPYDWTVPFRWFQPCGIPKERWAANKTKILFINPPFHSYFPSESVIKDQKDKKYDLPINSLSLGSYLTEFLPEAVDCRIIDFDYEITADFTGAELKVERIREIVESKIREFNPHIVGIGGVTVQHNLMEDILSFIKNKHPQILTIGGGPHISFLYEKFFDKKCNGRSLLDAAVIGEGEYALEGLARLYWKFDFDFHRLFDYVSNAETKCPPNLVFNTPDRSKKTKLFRTRTRGDDIPPIDFRALPGGDAHIKKASIILQTSRGCGKACNFCISSNFFSPSSVVLRPLEFILEDIRYLKDIGEVQIEFLDEIFDPKPGNMQYELCRCLATSEFSGMTFIVQTRADLLDECTLPLLKSARVSTLLIGVESASNCVLKKMNKKENIQQIEKGIRLAKKWNFLIGAYWIFAYPDSSYKEDLDSIVAMKKWTKDKLLDWNEMNFFVPYPGTYFYKKKDEKSSKFKIINKEFEEWLRFGLVRGYDKKNVAPVHVSETYPKEHIDKIIDYLYSDDALQLISRAEIPASSESIESKKNYIIAKMTKKLTSYYEESIESREKTAGKQVGYSDIIKHVFKILAGESERDARKKTLSGLFLNIIIEVFETLSTYLRIDFKPYSLFIIPLKQNEKRPNNNGNLVEQEDGRLLSFKNINEIKKIRLSHLAEDSEILREIGQNVFLYYYLVFDKEPYFMTSSESRKYPVRLFDTNDIVDVLNEYDEEIKKEVNRVNGNVSARWLIGIGLEGNSEKMYDRFKVYQLSTFVDNILLVFFSHLAALTQLSIDDEELAEIKIMKSEVDAITETYRGVAHEQVKGYRFARSLNINRLMELLKKNMKDLHWLGGTQSEIFNYISALERLPSFLLYGHLVAAAFSNPDKELEAAGKEVELKSVLHSLLKYSAQTLPFRLGRIDEKVMNFMDERVLKAIFDSCFEFSKVYNKDSIPKYEFWNDSDSEIVIRFKLELLILACLINMLEHLSRNFTIIEENGKYFFKHTFKHKEKFDLNKILQIKINTHGLEILNYGLCDKGEENKRRKESGTIAVIQAITMGKNDFWGKRKFPYFNWDLSKKPIIIDERRFLVYKTKIEIEGIWKKVRK